MEIFLLYVWTRLAALDVVLFTVLVNAAIITVLCWAAWLEQGGSQYKYAKRWSWITAVLCAIYVLTPTQKDAAIIAGGWLVKEAATSEVAKNIGERTYKLIVGKLDEELAKLEGAKKNE